MSESPTHRVDVVGGRTSLPLVVPFTAAARAEFDRTAARQTVRQGRAMVQGAALLAAVLVVPLVVASAVEGFDPRVLLMLTPLIPVALLARHGHRTARRMPPTLEPVAFTITPDEIRFDPYPSSNAILPASPAATWPLTGTRAEVRPSRIAGEQLVLRRRGARTRRYALSTLAVPSHTILALIPSV